jgi:hypothetical protein
MTIVVARRIGNHTLVISDTMISDNAFRPNILPGRLKTIVIDWLVSISYAGPANQGLDSVRECSLVFRETQNIETVLSHLRCRTTEIRDLEFIVSSHLRGLELYKIWNGMISAGQERQWIGDARAVNLILGGEDERFEIEGADDDLTIEQARLFRRFDKLTTGPASLASVGIGGFVVIQLGSPDGYCYLQHGAVASTDTVSIPGGLTTEQVHDRKTGKTEYQYNIIYPLERGVGIVGAYLPQTETLYTFDPLSPFDDPMRDAGIKLSEASALVKARVIAGGGKVSPIDQVYQAK